MPKPGYLYLLLAAVTYGFMGILVRWLDADIPPLAQIFLRYLVVFAIASAYVYRQRVSLSIRSRDRVLFVLVTLLGYVLSTVFFTLAILNTAIANALFILSSYSILTALVGLLYLKERYRATIWLALILALGEMVLLFQPNSFASWKIGGLYALLSGALTAFFIIGRKKLPTYPSVLFVWYGSLLGVLTIGLASGLTERVFYTSSATSVFALDYLTWGLIILFGVNNFLSWVLMTKGFATVPATTGSMLMLLEPVLAAGFAALFFTEVPNLPTVLGSILVLSAATITFRSELPKATSKEQ